MVHGAAIGQMQGLDLEFCLSVYDFVAVHSDAAVQYLQLAIGLIWLFITLARHFAAAGDENARSGY